MRHHNAFYEVTITIVGIDCGFSFGLCVCVRLLLFLFVCLLVCLCVWLLACFVCLPLAFHAKQDRHIHIFWLQNVLCVVCWAAMNNTYFASEAMTQHLARLPYALVLHLA